jgi:hypothetical protein
VSQTQPLLLRDLRGSFLRNLRVKPAVFGSREGREGAKTAKGKSFAIAVIATTLLSQATFAFAEESNTSDDIVVIARRLGDWRGNWKPNDGNATCKTEITTGDSEIDEIGCGAMLYCAPLYQAEADAAANIARETGKLRTREDSTRLARLPVFRKMTKCVLDRRKTAIRELVRRRKAAR